jgi:hypothetical protein
MTTTTNTAVFATRKPTIIERIAGYFQRRKFERQFAKAKAERAKLHEDIIAERRIILNN